MIGRRPPVLRTRRLLMTIPPPSAADRMVAYLSENAGHLAPWAPPRPERFLTRGHWQRRLRTALQEFRMDRSMRLVLFHRNNPGGPVLGACNFTDFSRGPLQSCRLGYSLDHRVEGQGLMTEALRAAIAYAFGTLRLHRIAATHMPENTRSSRVLKRLGFAVEGKAQSYLFINGAWRDHVLTALVNPETLIPRA